MVVLYIVSKIPRLCLSKNLLPTWPGSLEHSFTGSQATPNPPAAQQFWVSLAMTLPFTRWNRWEKRSYPPPLPPSLPPLSEDTTRCLFRILNYASLNSQLGLQLEYLWSPSPPTFCRDEFYQAETETQKPGYQCHCHLVVGNMVMLDLNVKCDLRTGWGTMML